MNSGPLSSLLTFGRQAGEFCLDVVFPPVCAGCRQVGALLCPTCAGQMERVVGPICFRCGHGAEPAAPLVGGLCVGCRRQPPPLVQMRAPFRYAEPTSQIIHRLKYEGSFALGRPLAQLLVAGWPAWAQPPDLIIPIPLHAQRRRQRGYNQSELLAQPLARALGLPCDAAALRRIRHTVPQVGLGPEARAENVRDAFAAAPERVGGRAVVLVDDVLTTGATMSAAAGALMAAGAGTVSAYCLARVS